MFAWAMKKSEVIEMAMDLPDEQNDALVNAFERQFLATVNGHDRRM